MKAVLDFQVGQTDGIVTKYRQKPSEETAGRSTVLVEPIIGFLSDFSIVLTIVIIADSARQVTWKIWLTANHEFTERLPSHQTTRMWSGKENHGPIVNSQLMSCQPYLPSVSTD